LTFATVSAIGVAGLPVLLPMMLLAARFASIASVTEPAEGVEEPASGFPSTYGIVMASPRN
jgi:hypothetical protein